MLDYPAIKEYREVVAGVPDDARGHLEQRIRTEGALTDALREWVADRVASDRPVLLLGDDVALLLQPLVNRDDAERARWRTVGCVGR